jgi:hypothetical protein
MAQVGMREEDASGIDVDQPGSADWFGYRCMSTDDRLFPGGIRHLEVFALPEEDGRIVFSQVLGYCPVGADTGMYE